MKRPLAPLLLAILLPLGGCGYHLGSIMHPQVHSVAVAPVKNETLEPLAGPYFQQALREQFILDGSLRVKELEEADCLLYGRVLSVENTSIVDESHNDMQEYRAAEWTVKVTVEYSVIIPGRAEELIGRRRITGTATYQVATDPDTARRRGVNQACRNAAQAAVVQIVEAW